MRIAHIAMILKYVNVHISWKAQIQLSIKKKKIKKPVKIDHNGLYEIYDMIDNIANENSMKLLQKPVTIDREIKTTTNNSTTTK